MRDDIVKQLALKNLLQFRVPVFRPNLFYEVRLRDAFPVSSLTSESEGSVFGDLLDFVRDMLKIEPKATIKPSSVFQTASSLVSSMKVLVILIHCQIRPTRLLHAYRFEQNRNSSLANDRNRIVVQSVISTSHSSQC